MLRILHGVGLAVAVLVRVPALYVAKRKGTHGQMSKATMLSGPAMVCASGVISVGRWKCRTEGFSHYPSAGGLTQGDRRTKQSLRECVFAIAVAKA